jgi:hypothetical protein
VNFTAGTIPPVRQIVIIISDLYFPSGEGEGSPVGQVSGALPGLEYAARFGETITLEDGWRAWLARWLGCDDLAGAAPASVAAAALADGAGAALGVGAGAAAGPDADAAADAGSDAGARVGEVAPHSTAWIATPVHLIAGLTSLHLDRRSILRLPQADLTRFSSDFQRVFSGSEILLKPMDSGEFLISDLSALRTLTTEPARALATGLGESLPQGADAPVLKRFGAELEMWLHEHPVNEARTKRGELPVSTLWLWGGGGSTTHADLAGSSKPPSLATGGDDSHDAESDIAFGSDAYLAGLWRLRGGESQPLPDQLSDVFSYPRAHRATLVVEVGPMLHANSHWTVFEALAELDRRFVSPALAALRRGEVECVVLAANDRRLLVRRGDRLKFWRRPRLGIEGLR